MRLPTTDYLTRSFVCLFGVAAIVWGLFVLPVFSEASSPHSLATNLLRDDTFKLQLLLGQAQQAERAARHPFCAPTALRSLFILRLFILNKAIAESDQALTELSYAPVVDAAREALRCTPTDLFIWLTIFWLDVGKHGLNPRNVEYLRLSYEWGRNEGWIALWRVRLVFPLLERLPPDLSDAAVDDFIRLTETGQFYGQTAAMFEDAQPLIQNHIVEKLKSTNIAIRQAFARTLHDRGIEADIPGVERPARPWR